MGRIFVLNYSLNDTSFDEIKALSTAMEKNINDDDKLLIMPHSFQLHEMKLTDLVALRDHVSMMIQLKEDQLR